MEILFFGATGWIGSDLVSLLSARSDCRVHLATSRLDDIPALIAELTRYCGPSSDHPKVTHIVLAAGLTGRPNVDWCEDHRWEVVQTNILGPSILAWFAAKYSIHLTYLGTGCIFEYDAEHPLGGKGFTETDIPNFDKSYYSETKIITEKILKEVPTALILRIRMPLSADLHPRSFLTKITKYSKVVDVPNSMTVLPELVPTIPEMMAQSITGIINFTNPGTISHSEMLALYQKYVDPEFTWETFSLEEQAKILKAGRSNNCMDASRLVSLFPQIRPIQESIIDLMQSIAALKSVKKTEA